MQLQFREAGGRDKPPSALQVMQEKDGRGEHGEACLSCAAGSPVGSASMSTTWRLTLVPRHEGPLDKVEVL